MAVDIRWNGNTGRSTDGRMFRKSDDGHVYEYVDGEYVPTTQNNDSTVDLASIKWDGEIGRTVDGRHFRKSGDSIYQRIEDKWVPIYKPESLNLAKANDANAEQEEIKVAKGPAPELMSKNITKREKVVRPERDVKEELTEASGGNTLSFLSELIKRRKPLGEPITTGYKSIAAPLDKKDNWAMRELREELDRRAQEKQDGGWKHTAELTKRDKDGNVLSQETVELQPSSAEEMF